jgi:hypothetical protein
MSQTSGVPTGKRSQAVPPLCSVGETSKTVLISTYNPRTDSNGYIHQSGTKLQAWFQDNAVGFAMENLERGKAWGLVGQAPSRGSTMSRFLPHRVYGAASLALAAGSNSQSLPIRAVSR